MSAEGFLIYNGTTGMVQVKDRVYRYLAAKAKKKDYDVLTLFLNSQKKKKRIT